MPGVRTELTPDAADHGAGPLGRRRKPRLEPTDQDRVLRQFEGGSDQGLALTAQALTIIARGPYRTDARSVSHVATGLIGKT